MRAKVRPAMDIYTERLDWNAAKNAALDEGTICGARVDVRKARGERFQKGPFSTESTIDV